MARRFDAVEGFLPFVESSPLIDGDLTLGEWSSRFEAEPAQEAELVGLIEANFLAGLRALDERLRGD